MKCSETKSHNTPTMSNGKEIINHTVRGKYVIHQGRSLLSLIIPTGDHFKISKSDFYSKVDSLFGST